MNIRKVGNKVTVTTNVGLTVDYDGRYNADITIGDEYSGNIRGICGRYDGNWKDLVKPDNTVATNGQDFIDSWKVDKSCPKPPKKPNPCHASESKYKLAKDKCAALKRTPFLECNIHVNVVSYIQDCEYDVCHGKGRPSKYFCEAYGNYADTCDRTDVKVEWRQSFKECGKFRSGFVRSRSKAAIKQRKT